MASKEERIQRCKAIVLHYQSLEKKDIGVEEASKLLDETLHLFPRTKVDDALYPVEELRISILTWVVFVKEESGRKKDTDWP